MSTLVVTTVETANNTTDLTVKTGNSAHGLIIRSGNTAQMNIASVGIGSSNTLIVNNSGIHVNSSLLTVNNTGLYVNSSLMTVNTQGLYVNGASAGAIGTLTDGANIAVNMGTYNNFSVTLNGSRNMDNPTNLVVGQSGIIFISQNSGGGQALTWSSYWKFPSNTAPSLTTTASAVDAVVYTVRTSTSITAQALLNIG